MSSIGRNAPCPCGSGKKYKQCHGPIDAEIATAKRKRKQAPDTLLPKIMESLDRFGSEIPAAIKRFWNDAYTITDIQELDQQEDRGSERFLTWFAFDYTAHGGHTLVQRLIADDTALELSDVEREVLQGWSNVRLQPFEVVEIQKGRGLKLRPLFGGDLIDLEDHKAAKRVEVDEVLIAHLLPVSDTHYIAGAAAQLTPDTLGNLFEFAAMHLEDLQSTQPDATYTDLIRSRSEIFNHFVAALPREADDVGKLDDLIAMTRVSLNLTAEKWGLRRRFQDSNLDDELVGVAAGYDGSDD